MKKTGFTIVLILSLLSCSQEKPKNNYIGKWSLMQFGETYTEIWLDSNFALITDGTCDSKLYSYVFEPEKDMVHIELVKTTKPDSNIQYAIGYMTLIKNVIDGREDDYVRNLRRIAETDSTNSFAIDTSDVGLSNCHNEYKSRR